jgi:hypothetical protein
MTALFLRVVLFVAFLLPVTTGDFSVNYTFVLYALFLALQAKRIERPNSLLLCAIATYSAIYLVGLGFDIFAPEALLLRRGVSFAIFMSMFAFVFVPFGSLETRAFKIAIVAVSFGFSLYAIARFYSVGGNNAGFSLKDATGSQRYGFVYLLAIFCMMTTSSVERWFQAARAVALFVVIAGLLLTFSRASIVALACVLPLFVLAPIITGTGPTAVRFAATGRRTGIAALYAAALFAVFPVSFQFYGDLILSRYAPLVEESLASIEAHQKASARDRQVAAFASQENSEALQKASARDRVFVVEGSEGTRIAIWQAIIANTRDHPLTGSSYLGAWHLDGINAGSSHSQYFDVLLRTGFPGILLYLVIVGQMLFFLWRREPGLFWGFLAMLVFGLFHETFKESQGAFILACLLGMHSAHLRNVVTHRQETAMPATVRP